MANPFSNELDRYGLMRRHASEQLLQVRRVVYGAAGKGDDHVLRMQSRLVSHATRGHLANIDPRALGRQPALSHGRGIGDRRAELGAGDGAQDTLELWPVEADDHLAIDYHHRYAALLRHADHLCCRFPIYGDVTFTKANSPR